MPKHTTPIPKHTNGNTKLGPSTEQIVKAMHSSATPNNSVLKNATVLRIRILVFLVIFILDFSLCIYKLFFIFAVG